MENFADPSSLFVTDIPSPKEVALLGFTDCRSPQEIFCKRFPVRDLKCVSTKLTPLNHNFFIGTTGGADHFCLQKSRMPIGRIGIFLVLDSISPLKILN